MKSTPTPTSAAAAPSDPVSVLQHVYGIYENCAGIARKGKECVEWMEHSVRNITKELSQPLQIAIDAAFRASIYISLRFLLPLPVYIATLAAILAYKRISSPNGQVDAKNLYNGIAFAASWVSAQSFVLGVWNQSFASLGWGAINVLFAQTFFRKSNLSQEIEAVTAPQNNR